MEAVLWALVVILLALAIILGITVYFRFFKRKTVVGMLAEKVKELQDKEVKSQEELELREMRKELEVSIKTSQEKIKDLKDKK